MAGTIKLGELGEYAERQFNLLVKAAVLTTDRRVKFASPVDTGRFRASWAIGQNSAPFRGQPEGEYPENLPPNAVNYTLGDERIGNVYSIHNNLIYAEPLARGRSKQAGDGWIDGIAKDIQSYVNIEADRIGRSS